MDEQNMKKVIEINGNQFDSEVLTASRPVLVDFHATWCGPCKIIAPLIEGLAAEFDGKIKFAKVDVDEAPELARQYNITGVPTLIFFKQGKPKEVMVGLRPAKELRQKLESAATESESSTCSCAQ